MKKNVTQLQPGDVVLTGNGQRWTITSIRPRLGSSSATTLQFTRLAHDVMILPNNRELEVEET